MRSTHFPMLVNSLGKLGQESDVCACPLLVHFKTNFQKTNDSKDTGMNMAVPTIREAQNTQDLHGADSLEVRVLAILHDSRVQIALACMLLLNVCILFMGGTRCHFVLPSSRCEYQGLIVVDRY